MSDPLSLVASGAAVLGLADVLLRASKELYSFFHELKDASRNVALVLAELDQLGALFASAQQYTNESEASNDCLAIPEVSKALENCRAEFEGLRAWVEKAGVGPGDGRVKRMAKKLKWVVDDAKLSHSRQNLERLKSSLGIALSAAGRRNDMTLRTEFRITKKDIQSFQQATQAQYSSLISTLPEYALRTQKVMRSNLQESASETTHLLQTNIERSISVNSEGLSSLETMVESSFSHVRDGLDNVEESMTASFNTTQQQLRIIHSDIKSSTNITHNQIQQQGRAAKQRLRQIHKNTNRSTNLQKQAIRLQGRTERKLDELYSKIASITISPQNSTSGWSKIESLNLAAVTLPLMLMRPALFSFLATLISEKELTISDADVKLFSQEFNTLLSECHMASAKSAYETSWSTGPSSDTHFFGTLSKIQENPQSATLTPKKAIQQHQRFYHETDAGYLEIAVEAGSAIESSSESAVYKAHFTFTPHISIAKIGLCLAIERGVGLSTNSNIARTLRTYKVLDPEQEDAYLKICLDDDVGELQKMLSRREISPWDRDRGSVSMIHRAIFHGSIRVVDLLLREGACYEFLSYFVAFQWLVVGFQEGNIFGFHLLRNRDHSLVHLYTKIFGMILEELSGIERDLVHKDAFECAARDHLTTSQSQELYSYFLLRMGLNVNELTGVRWSCWTPLLYATACFGTKNMPWIRTLLCNGFDIAATDGRGRNALHLVLMTCNKSDHMQYWRIIRRNIKEKLYLLLAAGCNPKAVDNNGLSPAHYAWKHNLWEVWEASLLSSGYDLEAAPPAIGKFGADPFFHAFRHCHFCD